MRQYPLVLIEWGDIKTESNWIPLSNVRGMEPVICHTVGFLIDTDRDRKRFIVAHTLNELDDSDRTLIPFGVVRSIKRLKRNGDHPVNFED